jgi:hypothetical protein
MCGYTLGVNMKKLILFFVMSVSIFAQGGELLEQYQLSPEYRAISAVSLKEDQTCAPNPDQSVFFASEVFGEDRLMLQGFTLAIYAHDFDSNLREVKIQGSTLKIERALEISFATTVQIARGLVESWAQPAENSYFWLTTDAVCENATTHFVSDYSVQRFSH